MTSLPASRVADSESDSTASAAFGGDGEAWCPTLTPRRGLTKHRLLTERIVADVESGLLPPRTRMPTHRDLARRLGVSVQTVSISYKEAERLGFLIGEVGRGTFVRNRVTEKADRFMLDRNSGDRADLSIVRCVYAPEHEEAMRRLFAAMAREDNSPFMQPCRPIVGLDAHRAGAQRWLTGLGLSVPQERIIVTNGAAHGLFLACAALLRRGDVVLTEELTDHGIIGLSSLLGFTLRGLPADREGVIVEAFEAACRSGKVAALVMVPTLGNPTSHVAGAERRRAIADVARRHGVYVIEDEVYKPLLAEALPSYADLLPDLGFFVTSFTKSVMTGLRAGYLVVPQQYAVKVASILRVTSWSATYLAAEIATRWIDDGTARFLLDVQRREIRARQTVVQEVLGPFIAGSHPLSPSAWLKVPDHWSEDGLVRQLARNNVAVTASDPFVSSPERPVGGIRICIGGHLSSARLRQVLTTVRATFEQLPPVHGVDMFD
ncbi:MocR-like ectoine utilization transcription factor EhuR [Pseudochelatococcus sp. B33]